jgi:uncharacterized protein YndB with AHSA1/START domain
MRLDVSRVIDRTPSEVFRFVATDHVHNHPRWDPGIELEQVTDGPIGVGTVIRRRHARGGTPVEGTMEITEFEPDRRMAALIREGGMEMPSGMEIEPEGDAGSRLTFWVEVPGITEPMDPTPIEGSLARIQEMLEAE